MGQANEKLSPKTIKEIHDNTAYTDDQIKEWFESFKKDSPDGKVTLEKLKEVYTSIFPHGDANAFAEDTFRAFDVNKDGQLDFKEFILAVHVTRKGTPEERMAASFRLFDEDGKGSITENEMLSVFNAYYNMIAAFGLMTIDSTPQKETENFFKALDKNSDGQITHDEFMANAKNNPMIMNVLNFHVKTEPVPAESGKAEAKEVETKPEEAPKTEAAPTSEAKTEEAPTGEAKTEEAPTGEAKTEAAPQSETKTEEEPKSETKEAETPKAESKEEEKPTTEAGEKESPKTE